MQVGYHWTVAKRHSLLTKKDAALVYTRDKVLYGTPKAATTPESSSTGSSETEINSTTIYRQDLMRPYLMKHFHHGQSDGDRDGNFNHCDSSV